MVKVSNRLIRRNFGVVIARPVSPHHSPIGNRDPQNHDGDDVDEPRDQQVPQQAVPVRQLQGVIENESVSPLEIDVFTEVTEDEVSVFVHDRGVGFDPAAVPHDRRGLADSIEGRLARAGGRATITSEPGNGTEIELTLPRRTT